MPKEKYQGEVRASIQQLDSGSLPAANRVQQIRAGGEAVIDAALFREQYSARSGITTEEFDLFYVALPCGCDSPDCEGWAAVINNPRSIKTHIDLYSPEQDTEEEVKP